MAYTAQGALVFNLQDDGGVKGSLHMPVLFDPTRTATQLIAAWNTQAVLLDAVTGCRIVKGSVVLDLAGAGITFTPKSPSPTVGSTIEKTGNVDYPNTVDGGLYDSIIPGISTPPLLASGRDIDESAGSFTAYIAPFETPPTDWRATNNTFQTLDAHSDSFVSFRKHRKQRQRLSKEVP